MINKKRKEMKQTVSSQRIRTDLELTAIQRDLYSNNDLQDLIKEEEIAKNISTEVQGGQILEEINIDDNKENAENGVSYHSKDEMNIIDNHFYNEEKPNISNFKLKKKPSVFKRLMTINLSSIKYRLRKHYFRHKET